MDGDPSVKQESSERVVSRQVEPVESEAPYRVLETVAEAEGVDITELPPIYERVNDVLDSLFSDPPTAESRMVITFSYCGYRIRIDQEGLITLQKE